MNTVLDEPSTTLEVVHETVYAYAAPVSLSHHLAHLRPLHVPGQRLIDSDLHIDPPPAFRRDSVDGFGNACTHFELTHPHRHLRVRARSIVTLSASAQALQPQASPAWEDVAHRLRYAAGLALEPAVEFTGPSPYVPRLQALQAWAQPCFAPGTPLAVAAMALMRRLHREFRYDSRSTEVDTPLAQAFAERRGVCQDFAHLLIGALRMRGLAARYVSGYLLTEPAAGAPALLGADASHAWVELWCPLTPGVTPGVAEDGWLGLDPTNDLVPGQSHVRLATGRDYGDVAPLRGVMRGGGAHTLQVAVTTRRRAAPDAQVADRSPARPEAC